MCCLLYIDRAQARRNRVGAKDGYKDGVHKTQKRKLDAIEAEERKNRKKTTSGNTG